MTTTALKIPCLKPQSFLKTGSCFFSLKPAPPPSARPEIPKKVNKKDQPKSLTFKWHKLCYTMRQMNQLGMRTDDYILIDMGDKGKFIENALRRLSPEERDQRNWRRIRAHYLTCQKKVLPEEEWVKYEDDMPEDSYLQPYLDELKAEEEEKKKWANLK